MVSVRVVGLSGIAPRAAVLAGLWWLIAQGEPAAWVIGVPAVGLAAWASVRLGGLALPRFSPAALVSFVALFLGESLRGGLDVALRTLRPTLRVAPGFHRYRLRVADPAARVLLINCIGLLPGTLATDLDGDHAELHLLDSRDNPDAELLRLERAIARLFRLPLGTEHG